MPSTYSTNLAIELIGTGDQSGTWGNTTNTNLGTLIEQSISGVVTQAVSTGTDTTITIPNGATGVARNMYIELTGTGGASTNLIVPSNKKLYFIFNNTASGQVTVKVSGQTGVSVPNGRKVILAMNSAGTDIVDATNYMSSLSVGTLNGIIKGTTGVFSAATAGTDYVAPGTATTFTATQTFNGTSSTAAIREINIIEPASVTAVAPTATTNFYINTGAVQYITANNANNWTLNFAFSAGTTLNAAMTTNDSLSCTLITTNSTTAYYLSAITVDGTSSGVTVEWQGGSAPTSGNASSLDSYTFVIIKTGSAVYTILASQTKFA
jgi:hypothetical protein